jgi:cell division protein FtsI (penicillin-binding protein 3)
VPRLGDDESRHWEGPRRQGGQRQGGQRQGGQRQGGQRQSGQQESRQDSHQREATPALPRQATRTSRLSQARRYHPRARTVSELTPTPGGAAASRPVLRLVSSGGVSSGGVSSSGAPLEQMAANRRKAARPGRASAPGAPRARVGAVRTGAGRRLGRLADSSRRLRVGTALILVVLAVIAGRLVQFQVADASAFAAEGLENRLETVDVPAARGAILDRDGAVLADSVEARYVFADPGLVDDPGRTADALLAVLGVPRSELLPKLKPHRRPDGSVARFEYLVRGVDVATGQAVSALNLHGIGVRRDERRAVPGHDLAANLIGFTGRDLTGLAGLEESYDSLLRGVDGQGTFEIGQPDGLGNLDHEIPGGYHQETRAHPGSSLVLTIDRDLQFEIQRVLGARMRQVRATMGSAVVLDVRNGEVLAQASYPFYDAADPLAYREADRGDVASGLAVDPGSVHKTVVMAACLQEGVVTPSSSVLVPPKITKGDTTYTDTHYHSTPIRMTLPGILAWSSNVGMITLADQLGADRLYHYQRLFGLGELTGEGLPGESAGLVQPPSNWSVTSHGSIPIGMGVSVTPLQMAAVYAAIANGGVWVRPHLLKTVVSADGTASSPPAATTRQVISAQNAAALRTMLEAVVTVPGATGLSAAVPGYRVAGKTGTGKLVRDGHYAPGEVASFVGMAPADAPRYVIAVFAYTPGGNGGAVAGPAFSEMMQYTLHHYRVAPTATKPPKLRVYP